MGKRLEPGHPDRTYAFLRKTIDSCLAKQHHEANRQALSSAAMCGGGDFLPSAALAEAGFPADGDGSKPRGKGCSMHPGAGEAPRQPTGQEAEQRDLAKVPRRTTASPWWAACSTSWSSYNTTSA